MWKQCESLQVFQMAAALTQRCDCGMVPVTLERGTWVACMSVQGRLGCTLRLALGPPSRPALSLSCQHGSWVWQGPPLSPWHSARTQPPFVSAPPLRAPERLAVILGTGGLRQEAQPGLGLGAGTRPRCYCKATGRGPQGHPVTRRRGCWSVPLITCYPLLPICASERQE